MSQNSAFQLRSHQSSNSDANDAFSKPIVRRRFQATQAQPTIVTDDSILPSVSDDSHSPLQVFSPPVSIPETSSDGNGDNNLSSSDSEPDGQSQSSTSSLNQKFKSISTVPKISRAYDFDEEDEEDGFVQPVTKKQKSDSSTLTDGAKFIPKKEKKPVYNHKWTNDDEDEEEEKTLKPSKPIYRETRPIYKTSSSSGTSTSSYSSQNRVRNVKDSNEILESGEYDDFKHDIIYVLSTLNKSTSSLNVKCLSTISLAKKCALPDFRQFINSENMAGSLLKALADAPENDLFALSASTVIYLLLRDFNSMRIDFSALKLLSQLLRIEEYTSQGDEKDKIVNMVWDVFGNYLQKQQICGKKVAFDIKKEKLTPSSLILEAMVFITTRCGNDETFKTELLNLGILQFIVAKIEKTVNLIEGGKISYEDETFAIITLDRCFRVLEMCSMLHKKNQAFLISHRSGTLINSLAKFLALIHKKVPKLEEAKAKRYMGCMALLTRVSINLTHENELCCSKLGQVPGFLKECLMSFTYLAPKFAEEEKKYDINVMMSALLVNLVERCNVNRKTLIATTIKMAKSTGEVEEVVALEALAKLFVHHEATAKSIDEDMDKEMFEECDEEANGSSSDDEEGVRKDGRLNRDKMENMDQEDAMNAIQQVVNKASAHMEDSIVASYIALLIGSLLQQNEENSEVVRKVLPNKKFNEMAQQLNRFLEFMKVTLAKKRGGTSGFRSIERIVDVLERLD